MTRRLQVLALATTFACASALPPTSAHAAERCVGKPHGCHATLQAALDAAGDGDTIRIKAGTHAGGATVTKSVTLAGAGQHATTLSGGGPVLAIGTFGDETPPTVTVRDLTITGGRTNTSPQSVEFFGQDGVFALGGGIAIPPGPFDEANERFAPGATVTVTRTRITGNRVAPTATVPSGLGCGDACPFALAAGGGIDSWGNLTVIDSTISDNRAGALSGPSSLASDAEGGAIHSLVGSLSVLRSRISDNQALAAAPNGRFADAGGIFSIDSPFIMRDSHITGNRANLAAAFPAGIDMLALAGGIHLADQVPTGEITRSAITGNSTQMTNTVGDVVTFSGGMHVDGGVDFTIADSLIAANHVTAKRLATGAPGFTHGDGGAGQLFGQMARTRVLANTVTATAPDGDVEAMAGGLWSQFGQITDSQLAANQLRASSRNGTATARGAGAVADTDPERPEPTGLSFTDSSVTANVGVANGNISIGQGGGIFDAALPPFGPFGAPLTLTGSTITHNVLLGPPGATLQGGGVYLSGHELTQTGSVIARNHPDQCFGCEQTAARRAAPLSAPNSTSLRGRHTHTTALSRTPATAAR
jgi:hypothetical protein